MQQYEHWHVFANHLDRPKDQVSQDFLTVVTTLLRSPKPQVIELVPPGTPATGPP
jgi:hypothetical protein